jgi:hypothetical protein
MSLQLVLPLPELTGKRCSTCKETKPVSEFSRNRNSKDGLQNNCKECARGYISKWQETNPDYFREAARRWAAENPERVRENARRWQEANAEKKRGSNRRWREANPEKVREAARRRREANPEKARETRRRWAAENPESDREYSRRYRKKHPETIREGKNRRRARKRSNGIFTVTDKDLRRVYDSPCWACGATDNVEWDHRVPVARGGSHGIGNALPLCRSCNASKSSRLLSEWRYRDQLTKRKAA